MEADRWTGGSPEDAERRQKRQELRDWINHVREDVAVLIANREMFRRVADMWRSNPQLQGTKSSFWDWMWRVYTPALAIGIRRQVDSKNEYDPQSFWRFLSELLRNSELISRTWIRLGLADQQSEESKQRHIDELIGAGNSHLQKRDVYEDRKRLQKVAEKIKTFADKRVAHRAPGALDVIPTFKEADDALDTMEQLLRKYLRLIGEHEPESFVPRPQWPNDDLAFRIPWIPEPEKT